MFMNPDVIVDPSCFAKCYRICLVMRGLPLLNLRYCIPAGTLIVLVGSWMFLATLRTVRLRCR